MYYQKGSVVQGIFNFIFFGFAIFIGIKAIPIYYEYYTVNSLLKTVSAEINRDNLPLVEVKNSARKRFEVNNVSAALAEQLKFVKYQAEPYLVLDYEVREPLFSNVALLVSFHLDYEVSYDGEVKEVD